MSFFLNLPISKKLLLAFSLMAVVVLALGCLPSTSSHGSMKPAPSLRGNTFPGC